MHRYRFLLDDDRRRGIGHGGTGRLYRAQDTLLDRHVAVKVLSAPELGTEGRTRLDWAETHAARGEPGDRERVRELLHEAQAAFGGWKQAGGLSL
jgi:serine/threonine protein kinase